MILLDRDGVLNVDRAESVRSLDDLEVEVGAIEGCRRLRAAGITLAVVTNQSAVGRGWMTRATLDTVNLALDEQLGGAIDRWFVCDHGPDARCRCRKPGTLLLEQARSHYGFDPARISFVADADRDIEAARAFGCRPVLVRTGKGAATAISYPDVPSYADLDGFATAFLADPAAPALS